MANFLMGRLSALGAHAWHSHFTPRLRADWTEFSVHGSSPAQQNGSRDAHFLDGAEKCCVSPSSTHFRVSRFRFGPARQGVSRRHKFLCPESGADRGPRSSQRSGRVIRSSQSMACREQLSESRPSAGGNCRQFSAARVTHLRVHAEEKCHRLRIPRVALRRLALSVSCLRSTSLFLPQPTSTSSLWSAWRSCSL